MAVFHWHLSQCYRWYGWLTLLYQPLLLWPKKLLENTQAYARTTVSPPLLPRHITKCLPITVLHIRMLPRLPQRTKQPYAKQAGIPTYIVMRQCEKGKAGAGRGVKHEGGETGGWRGRRATGELVGTIKGHVR